MRDNICRPEGVHGCYDFKKMRKFDDLIEELKTAAVNTYTKIVEYYSEGGDLTFIMKETWNGQERGFLAFRRARPNGEGYQGGDRMPSYHSYPINVLGI